MLTGFVYNIDLITFNIYIFKDKFKLKNIKQDLVIETRSRFMFFNKQLI
jgi:hypothetical protein